MRRPAALAAALAVLLLSGCATGAPGGTGSSVDASTPAPSGGVLATPPPAPDVSGTRVTLPIHHGGAPAIAGPTWSALRVGPGAALTLQWAAAGALPCGAVNGVWISETATTVVVALGAHPRERGHICPLVVVPHTAVVQLSAPLGSRRLLEPSRNACVRPLSGNDEAGRICPMRPAP